MLIRPKQKLKNKLFYNNICLIITVFCIIFLITSIILQNSVKVSRNDSNISEGMTYGPIKITKDPKIYKINATFYGDNTNSYLSGEVLDEEKDTLYEFGKDLWHESGYDSEGYWSESETNMTAYLTFSEKGTYYIQFRTDENNMRNIGIQLTLVKGSYVAHLQFGVIMLLLVMAVFWLINRAWIIEKSGQICEKLEEMSDD